MESSMQWEGEASRLLKTIGGLANREGKVSIGLLSDYVSLEPGKLLDTLRAMETANIVSLDERAGTVSVQR